MLNDDNGQLAVESTRTMNGRLRLSTEDGAVERFVGDDRPIEDTEDRIVSRMRTPSQALSHLATRSAGRFDLFVNSASAINFVADPGSDSGVAIAPMLGQGIASESENGGRFAAALAQRGSIPVTKGALDQMARLLGASGGWKRYAKMDSPVTHFLRDVRGRFGSDNGEPQFIARANGVGLYYQIEAFVPPKVDRTDSSIIVAQAMRGIIARYGDIIRGVEMLMHEHGGSFRILFGDPLFQDRETNQKQRLYTMLNLQLSDSRRFHPSANIGLWRMWCLNGALFQASDFASFKADAVTTGESFVRAIHGLVEVAAPIAGAVASQIESLQSRPLDGRAADIVTGIYNRSLISEAQKDNLISSIEAGGGDGTGVETEWDMFNTFTDAAKFGGTIHTRARLEGKSLMFALSDGGFSGLARHGFNRTAFQERMKSIYETHVGDPRSTGLGRVAALN